MNPLLVNPGEEFARIEQDGRRAIEAATTLEELEAVRVQYLGRKGRLTLLLRQLGQLSEAVRPAAGREGNRVKDLLSRLLEERARALEAEHAGAAVAAAVEDRTLPGRARWRGGLHPCTQVTDEICEIFRTLGFVRGRSPEAETVWYNFTALNTSLDHPAADAQATFYLQADAVLRTHTTPMQIHVMQSSPPPIRVVVPGVVYRRDPWDASHAPAFEQVDGLAVDEGISFVDLKAAIAYFVRELFGRETKTRFRPSFFPFTEPSAEVEVSCTVCGGGGCSTCKGTGWMEIMGCGMVHPAVFEAVGYDAERYTGYAFGMGITRIALVRYGIPDIRLLYEGDMRFLEQFA
ncbi:MAG: phenylalanine--tRNA ligase subunit alpha [Gemmatimonadetes bacterium]|nr:phenylalanine--tRNA ligase subunit alpha [Gemmatimonadota bacterium]